MQQQYQQIKGAHPDKLVLFRLGDFYEAFNSDAETLASVLGITLTGRGKDANRVPMAGIPYHALDNYLPRLLRQGYKVAIVEQLSQAKQGELVERDVTKIYTAGTLNTENTLEEETNNYLVAIDDAKKTTVPAINVSICDVSVGKLSYCHLSTTSELANLLGRINPSEIIVSAKSRHIDLLKQLNLNTTVRADADFNLKNAYEVVAGILNQKSLKGFGLAPTDQTTQVLAALLSYVLECNRAQLHQFTTISVYNPKEFMSLGANAIRNLELVHSPSGHSVYQTLNTCVTNMGKRKLYDWLVHPLLNAEKLTQRWLGVEYFAKNSDKLDSLRQLMREVPDIERVVARLASGGGNARDLLAIASGLQAITRLTTIIDAQTQIVLVDKAIAAAKLTSQLQQCLDLINQSIQTDPSPTITQGDMILTGYNQEVDRLRELKHGGKNMLMQIQTREVQRTGISSLKVGYNQVFGYYIEVTTAHLSKVPADYIRKQTLTNAERFITPELKEWETKVLNAETELAKLEYELFLDIRSQAVAAASELLGLADQIATLDVIACFAQNAREHDYCKPELVRGKQLKLTKSRHVVVERLQQEFTPNDLLLDDRGLLILLTGPNMAGKSTYIRQAALCTLLAQAGSFVPAEEMEFSIADQIFTRIGASDNLAQGESTFMVEMHETAYILHNATSQSLVILDEVGRGTSTYDGVAIAWSVAEHLATKTNCFTLFATHYHELTELTNAYPQICNFKVQVLETDAGIKFTHKIVGGIAGKSYGIHVAQMAGVPVSITTRASQILSELEKQTPEAQKQPKVAKLPKKFSPQQLDLL